MFYSPHQSMEVFLLHILIQKKNLLGNGAGMIRFADGLEVKGMYITYMLHDFDD